MAGDRATTNLARCVLAIVAVEIWAMSRSVEAATYVVGGSTGWNTPGNGASFYSNWASGYTFRLGDVLVFNFIDGQHSVGVVTEQDFNSCNTANPIALYTNSPVDYNLNITGTMYFICTHDSHCLQGQKLAVTVGTSSGPGAFYPPPPPYYGGTGYLYVSSFIMFASVATYFLVV